MGCHFLLQGTFPIQGSNQRLLLSRQILHPLRYWGSQCFFSPFWGFSLEMASPQSVYSLNGQMSCCSAHSFKKAGSTDISPHITPFIRLKHTIQGAPRRSRGQDLVLSLQRVQAPSLSGKLRSHKLHGQKEKNYTASFHDDQI